MELLDREWEITSIIGQCGVQVGEKLCFQAVGQAFDIDHVNADHWATGCTVDTSVTNRLKGSYGNDVDYYIIDYTPALPPEAPVARPAMLVCNVYRTFSWLPLIAFLLALLVVLAVWYLVSPSRWLSVCIAAVVTLLVPLILLWLRWKTAATGGAPDASWTAVEGAIIKP